MMEIDPFGRNNHESSPGDKADDDSSPKKKKKSRRASLPNTGSEKSEKSSVTSETSDDKKVETAAEPLWRRILGQPEEDKEKSDETNEEAPAASEETGAQSEQSSPLESLSEAEQLEVAEAYIAARHAELVQEQAAAVEGEDEAAVQERAADITLLEAMRRLLAQNHTGEQPLEEPVEAAYDSTVQHFGWDEHVDSKDAPDEAGLESQVLPLPPTAAISLRHEQHEPVAHGFSIPRDQEQSAAWAAPEVIKDEDSTAGHRRVGSALLVGGLVGYFVGRRRGRIKTEKQFKSVEAKLTKQVNNIEQQVMQKEQQIRRLAREAYETRNVLEVRSINERVMPKTETAPVVRSEHLGLLTLKAAEKSVPNGAKASPEKVVNTPKKKVEALSRAELLTAAAEVQVGATNLRRVYETNLITEQGLRRLVAVHESGGNVRESLEREIVEKETSYERDPHLRNRSMVGSLAASKVVRADIDRPQSADAQTTDASHGASTDNSVMPAVESKPTATATPPAAIAAVVTLVVIIAVLLVILFTGA